MVTASASDASRQTKQIAAFREIPGGIFGRALCVMVGGALALSVTGCTLTLAPLAKDTAAFSAATAVVIDNSKDVYATANDLHKQAQVVAQIDAYDKGGWRPDTPLKPMLTPQQLAARTKVLDALNVYL